mmetsp:Transcript_100386/g.259276  ORF Transcript_100386/g.259276 Transcript_100386/m.259276 type:complete len:269 (-) Transcript_100386:793-1599(-)
MCVAVPGRHHRPRWRALGRSLGLRGRAGDLLGALGLSRAEPLGLVCGQPCPTALRHAVQQGSGEAAIRLQRHPAQDEVGGAAAGRVRSADPVEASLPEDDHHRGADGIGCPTLLGLLQDSLLVVGIGKAVRLPEHSSCSRGPAPAGELLPHLSKHSRDQLRIHPVLELLGRLPQLQGLAAADDPAAAHLADELKVMSGPHRRVHQEEALVQAVALASALNSADLPDLLCTLGPNAEVLPCLVGLAGHPLRRARDQHHVPQQAARSANL